MITSLLKKSNLDHEEFNFRPVSNLPFLASQLMQ